MNNIGKRLMPIYLIKFLEENYFDIIPENFGKRMVSRQFIAEIKALYDEFDGKPIDNYGRVMVPEYLIKAFSDIEYIEYTDDDVKYEKTVPTGALKYATLDMLGGMSYKAVNLFDKTAVTLDKSLGSAGNITDDTNYFVSDYIEVKESETYNYNLSIAFNTCFYDENKTYISGGAYATTFETPETTKYIRMSATKARLETLMICKGTTYPSSYVEYVGNFDGIRDSAVTSVVAKKTYEIDEHILALDGYGWGINDTCYNYIDYENKKFIQNVGRVDLGTLTWTYDSEYNRFIASIDNIKIVPTRTLRMLCAIYDCKYNNEAFDVNWDMVIYNYGSGTTNIVIHNHNYTTAEALKTAMSGVYLYYELATFVETDISDYIKDNFIEVEPTGSVTFTNEYEQAVPSEVTYLIKE